MILETVICIVVGLVCFITGRLTADVEGDFDKGYSCGWEDAFDVITPQVPDSDR